MKPKYLLTLMAIFISLLTIAQNTYIPDDNFEQGLIDLGYDDVLDDYVLTANIIGVTVLNIDSKNISNLTGIEDFVALLYLTCSSNQLTSLNISNNIALEHLSIGQNQLTSLDVSNNIALRYIDCRLNQLTGLDCSNNIGLDQITCESNQLTSLNVSNNIALEYLYCQSNQLTSLNVSNNIALKHLYCHSNKLTGLDVSTNIALWQLSCNDNQLTSLDVKNGNNVNFIWFDATNNPNLTCIQVDDAAWSTAHWTGIDPTASFSEDCGPPPSIPYTNRAIYVVIFLVAAFLVVRFRKMIA